MNVTLSLWKKMFLIGLVVVIGLCVLGGNSYLTNRNIKEITHQTEIREKKLEIVTDLELALLNLMLAAMDSIIDKDSGFIDAEMMNVINSNTKLMAGQMDALMSVADTSEETRLARKVAENYVKLSRGIRTDLVKLIESNAADEEFAQNDDLLDGMGNQIENDLKAIARSIRAEQQEALEAEDHLIDRSTYVSVASFLLTLAVSIPVIFLIARSVVKPIQRAINGLNEGSEQVTSASGQVSSASQQLAEGSSEQAAAIEETSASLEEMASMTKRNADNAGQADNLMKEANQVVGKANNSMAELTTAMEDISKASEETSKIIKTIDEIAFQTNLLALNAAVKAARAGEAGAGFAVVADEVRNLAMRAAEAARNTATLIDSTVKKINDGTALVTGTNEAFAEVADSAGKVGELVGEIAAASKEQAHGIDQVNSAITQMDKVTQSNAANAEESASAAEELSAQASEMRLMIAELVKLVTGSRNDITHNSGLMAEKINKKEAPNLPQPATEKTRLKTVPAVYNNEVTPEDIIPLEDDFKEF